MAWNPSPKVAAARDIGQRFGKDIVVVLAIHDGVLEAISYGRTRALCAEAKRWSDLAFEALSAPPAGGPPKEGE